MISGSKTKNRTQKFPNIGNSGSFSSLRPLGLPWSLFRAKGTFLIDIPFIPLLGFGELQGGSELSFDLS